MMNIVIENLISLLCEGAFQAKRSIMPMSEFKWRILYKLAVIEDVAPYIYKGVLSHEYDSCLNIPTEVKDQLAASTFNEADDIDSNFDIEDIEKQKLSYIVKRYTLKDIVYKERHSIDTSKITLDLLAIILQNTNAILRNGIRLRGITELGIFLRTKGQLVDFVKLEAWIQRLKLRKMSRLQASVLTQIFGFTQDEFPYIKKNDKRAKPLAEKSIYRVYRANKLNRPFSKYNISNSIRFYGYSHSEAICKATSTIVRNLSEIEE